MFFCGVIVTWNLHSGLCHGQLWILARIALSAPVSPRTHSSLVVHGCAPPPHADSYPQAVQFVTSRAWAIVEADTASAVRCQPGDCVAVARWSTSQPRLHEVLSSPCVSALNCRTVVCGVIAVYLGNT